MGLNIWKDFQVNVLKTQIYFGLEVYMHLLSVIFPKGGLFLKKEFPSF